VAAAAAFVIACGGGDGPDARQQLGGEIAQFGYWEILVHGYHTDLAIERRRVFRDVHVIPATQMPLYVNYLDALRRAEDVHGLRGASSRDLNRARTDFRNARRAIEDASAEFRTAQGWDAPNIRRENLEAAIHRALVEDFRTISYWRGSLGNTPAWWPNGGTNQAPREFQNNFFVTIDEGWGINPGVNEVLTPGNNWGMSTNPGTLGPRGSFWDGRWSIPLPIQRVLVEEGFVNSNFIVDAPHIHELHAWIVGALDIFLNRYWDTPGHEEEPGGGPGGHPDQVLTQRIVDDMTRSLTDAVNVLVGIRRLRDASFVIALHPHDNGPGSQSSPVFVPHSSVEGSLPSSRISIASNTVNIPASATVEWLPIDTIQAWSPENQGPQVPVQFTTGQFNQGTFAGIEAHGGAIGGVSLHIDRNARIGGANGAFSPNRFRDVWVIARYTYNGETFDSNPIVVRMEYWRNIRIGVPANQEGVRDVITTTVPAFLNTNATVPLARTLDVVRPEAPTLTRTVNLSVGTERIPGAPALDWFWSGVGHERVPIGTTAAQVPGLIGVTLQVTADGGVAIVMANNSPVGDSLRIWAEYNADTTDLTPEEAAHLIPRVVSENSFVVPATLNRPEIGAAGDVVRGVLVTFVPAVPIRILGAERIGLIDVVQIEAVAPAATTTGFLTSMTPVPNPGAPVGHRYTLNALSSTGVTVWSVRDGFLGAEVAAGDMPTGVTWVNLTTDPGLLNFAEGAPSGSMIVRATEPQSGAFHEVELRWSHMLLAVTQTAQGSITHTGLAPNGGLVEFTITVGFTGTLPADLLTPTPPAVAGFTGIVTATQHAASASNVRVRVPGNAPTGGPPLNQQIFVVEVDPGTPSGWADVRIGAPAGHANESTYIIHRVEWVRND
jgi:hypothetical protein